MEHVTVYDQQQRLLGVLENADGVSYQLKHNDLWVGDFQLPADDPKNEYCQAHNYVRMVDGKRKLGLYRIIGIPNSEDGAWTEYQLEHVMATLLDDVLFGYHEIGGYEITTRQVMEYILARQTEKRWQLGDCDFQDEYAYKFENETLLSALMSLGNVLTEDFTWVFDTETTPWTVHLRRADSTPGCGIHYMRNLKQITRSMDASALVTRLYCLGYGEGVNQLTIKEVNGGKPYLDADTQNLWGIKCAPFIDTRIEDGATLKERGLHMLEQLKNPYWSYTASAIDLHELTGDSWDTHMPGKLVTVMDDAQGGASLTACIVSISKGDIYGAPMDISVTIANAPKDVAASINQIADRVGIAEQYSQGATNQYAQQFADNADESHPAVMRVYIPARCVRINQMLLSWLLSAFRAYSHGAASGGGSSQTSSSGGGGTVTAESVISNTTNTTARPMTNGEVNIVTDTAVVWESTLGQSHRHGFDHYHQLILNLTIPGQKVTIGSHSHSVTIPSHTHSILYGIYEGSRASKVTLRVDGNAVPDDEAQAKELDIVPWLSRDTDGKIARGTWHTIELVPDKLTRIEANLFLQTFVQSVGGGDY